MGRLEPQTLLGLLIGIGAILVGQAMEGGAVGTLLNGSAFVVVVGGTLGAVIVQTSPRQLIHAFSLLKWLVFPPETTLQGTLDRVLNWAFACRHNGLLALEKEAEVEDDEFARKGLTLLADGNSVKQLRDVLDMQLILEREHHLRSAKVFEAMGGYSPTVGIIGAVLGLIQAMAYLDSPSELGGGIASAFVATIYGVGFANLLYLPVANRLRQLVLRRVDHQEMIIEGLISVANGENPRNIELKLSAFLNN